MAADPDLLLRGLEALATLLPDSCRLEPSSLSKTTAGTGDWVVVRQGRKHITCLVLCRRRVEIRDLGAIAAAAARTSSPALLLSTYLTPSVRERLDGFGIGHWDLTGNARIDLPDIELQIALEGSGTGARSGHSVRSLSGEMAGRVVRLLVDVAPPYALGTVAQLARVETSYASRVLAYLGGSGLIRRRARGAIEEVDWPEVLRRWTLDAPIATRGRQIRYTAVAGIADFLSRLGASGFLHALTGEVAMTRLMDGPAPRTAALYVDDAQEAAAQFRLHAAEDGAIELVTPADRSVYQRSTERAGLRCVSPSLIAADLDAAEQLERLIAWMRDHEQLWRLASDNLESDDRRKSRKRRRKGSNR